MNLYYLTWRTNLRRHCMEISRLNNTPCIKYVECLCGVLKCYRHLMGATSPSYSFSHCCIWSNDVSGKPWALQLGLHFTIFTSTANKRWHGCSKFGNQLTSAGQSPSTPVVPFLCLPVELLTILTFTLARSVRWNVELHVDSLRRDSQRRPVQRES